LLQDLFKSRRRLAVENLFLRHQLNITLRRPQHLRLLGGDRALSASQNGSEVPSASSEPKNTSEATKRLSVTRQRGTFAIIPDAQWRGMHRIRRPDGALTGMVNLTESSVRSFKKF
jgi:hypothetical protein